ncbi:MAG: DNA-3-methyladenine glycosylase [Candidatus Promineifilaceae bacterium]
MATTRSRSSGRDTVLPQSFYARPAREVAAALLGTRLVRLLDGGRLAGVIVEAEAYCDAEERDLACHGDRANGGRPTARTAVMFGPPGHAYLYFTYGMHWMFNVVTGHEGQANGVLIRALEPVEGEEVMAANRGGAARAELTNGPGKLTQALAIDRGLKGANLWAPGGVLWLERDREVPSQRVAQGPRIGLGQTPEPWRSVPWRFWIADNQFVSR